MNPRMKVRTGDGRRFIRDATEKLNIALQPIVEAHSGKTLAYESLVRSFDDIGFPHPGALFEYADAKDRLFELDTLLIDKSVDAINQVRADHWSLLFVNLDGRLLPRWKEVRTFLEFRADQIGIDPSDICIELSETHQPLSSVDFAAAIEGLRQPGFMIAVDDFGTGNAGMQMLYESSPDFIKIDRYFIQSMPTDPKRRLMVSAIVDLAHTLGSRVIAEGVETAEELACCRDVNCDMLQGFLVARPTIDIASLSSTYKDVVLAEVDQQPDGSVLTVDELLEDVSTLSEEDTLSVLIDLLARETRQSVFPSVDRHGLPRGAVRERDVRPLLCAPFSRDLTKNKHFGMSINDYIKPITTLDCSTPLAPRLELIAERAGDGVVVTQSFQYRGYLSATALAKLAHEYRLMQAASQNPLTRLPGNDAIHGFLQGCVDDTEQPRIIAYLDIDNFKPFNDKYGFEMGDRALLILSSILKTFERIHGGFIGHIGGDDFFVGARGPVCKHANRFLTRVSKEFCREAENLYTKEDRENGYIIGRTRDGKTRKFPLLTCTAVALSLEPGYAPEATEPLSAHLTGLKLTARHQETQCLIEQMT